MKKSPEELKQLTDKVVKNITENFAVDEIILFGSYAKGEERDESDVDIAVVSPDFEEGRAMFKHVLDLCHKANLCEPYLQLVAFPSRIFYSETSYIDPEFIKEIKRTGKQLILNN